MDHAPRQKPVGLCRQQHIEITAVEKRNNWYHQYQEIPGVAGGMRSLASRVKHFNTEDFDGSSVLDLGSNVGQMSFWAAQHGASSVTGVEFDLEAYRKALGFKHRVPNGDKVIFRLDDLDMPTAWHNLPVHDVVLFLSLIDIKELENRFGMLARACMKTGRVLYFEGHLRQPLTKYFRYLLDYTDFTQIKHMGASEGRDLFRATRDILDTNQFYAALREAIEKYDRVGVVGNQLSGKTTLKNGIDPGSLPAEVRVLDDCKKFAVLGEPGKMIAFDYRAALYMDDLEVIFNVLSPRSKWETWRSDLSPLRSSKLRPIQRLREFHTVLTHGSLT